MSIGRVFFALPGFGFCTCWVAMKISVTFVRLFDFLRHQIFFWRYKLLITNGCAIVFGRLGPEIDRVAGRKFEEPRVGCPS